LRLVLQPTKIYNYFCEKLMQFNFAIT
jgi:hypothetical protein